MDLTTTYLGLKLAHPFVMGASPLVDDLEMVQRLEEQGAAAIVMHSLFEEQIVAEQVMQQSAIEPHEEGFSEARSYLPGTDEYALDADEYLRQIERIKRIVSIPVIGSLNGVSHDGWLRYAELMEQAGADALELNLYAVATDPSRDAASVEMESLEMVRAIKAKTQLKLALKLSPFYTALPHFVARARLAGVDGFVLFNRFYQPDVDPEDLEVVDRLELSTSSELLLRIRWLSILSAQNDSSFAVTGGVHTIVDGVKAIMAGAHAVQVVSKILRAGPSGFAELRDGLSRWLEERDYRSLADLRGSMNLARCPDPHAFQRSQYIRTLQRWRPSSIGIEM